MINGTTFVSPRRDSGVACPTSLGPLWECRFDAERGRRAITGRRAWKVVAEQAGCLNNVIIGGRLQAPEKEIARRSSLLRGQARGMRDEFKAGLGQRKAAQKRHRRPQKKTSNISPAFVAFPSALNPLSDPLAHRHSNCARAQAGQPQPL